LTISNTSATANNAAVLVAFIGNASNNTVTYCNLKASSMGNNAAPITFGPSSAPTGNANNIISNNLFTNNGNLNRNYITILSQGTPGCPNTGNSIINNEFKDCLSQTWGDCYISLIGSNNGYLTNNAWTISGNSFYETASFTNNGLTIIQIGASFGSNANNWGGTGYTITDNYFGGTQKLCGGSPMTKFIGGYTSSFSLMNLNFSSGGTNLIKNNTFQNFAWSCKYDGNSLNKYIRGIDLLNGNATIDGNTIGATTGNGSLNLALVEGGVTLMNLTSNGTVECKNNMIGSVLVTSTDAVRNNGVTCLSASGSGTFNIHDNTIGSTTTANSINNSSPSTLQTQNLTGISYSGTNVNNIINHNTVANLTNGSTNPSITMGGYISGISINGGIVTNNVVHDIVISNAFSTFYNVTATAQGIYSSSSLNATITGNTIYNITNNYPAYGGLIAGIHIPSLGNIITNTISGNLIYGLSANPASNGAKISGMYFNKGTNNTSNNIISLSANYPVNLYGILEDAAQVAGQDFQSVYNTILITGTPTTVGGTSACLSEISTVNSRIIKNNIFANTRINSGSAAGKNYAAYMTTSGAGAFTLDYNDYYSSGSGSNSIMVGNGTDYTSMTTWRTATSKDAHSVNVDPGFAKPSGTTGPDFLPSNLSLVGNPDNGFTLDFNGTIRNTSITTMGAIENPEISKVTTVDQLKTSGIVIMHNQEGISVQLNGESKVELYNINGVLLDKTKRNGVYSHRLNSGMYILRINDQVVKFIQ